jgi:hypothetical protein
MIREFKFFHGITIQTEGIGGLIRTLRARFEPELAEDLNFYHGIDAEAELTRLMSAQIAEGIDRGVMRTLIDTVNTENETDEEVLRGINVLNGDDHIDTTAMIRELTRTINGGQRA